MKWCNKYLFGGLPNTALFRGFGEEEPTIEMVGIIARVDLQSAEGSDWPQGRESFNALTTIQFVKKTKHCTKL